MCNSEGVRRGVARARILAKHLELCNAQQELDFESKRLNVLLGDLHGDCQCDQCLKIAKAYDVSCHIYLADTLDEAHTAAHQVADLLAHVA
jgi:hypothetical protein